MTPLSAKTNAKKLALQYERNFKKHLKLCIDKNRLAL